MAAQSDYFLQHGIKYIDYKDVNTLSKFINKRGQIIPRIYSKLTMKNQRLVAKAIKRARQMALLPYFLVQGRRIKLTPPANN